MSLAPIAEALYSRRDAKGATISVHPAEALYSKAGDKGGGLAAPPPLADALYSKGGDQSDAPREALYSPGEAKGATEVSPPYEGCPQDSDYLRGEVVRFESRVTTENRQPMPETTLV
jgi:hypothetical protein